jgi:hypothetical protein
MSLLNNSNAIPSGGAVYTMTDSIRWRASSNANLQRTYSTTPTDAKKLTLSLWMKRGKLSTDQIFLSGYNGSSADRSTLWLNSANQMRFNFGGGSATPAFITNQLFRDPSSWFHIVIAIDTTQGTSSNRVKLYINGEQVTSFASTSYPAQNATHQFLYQNSLNWIGTLTGSSYQFDGYITEFHAVDGQALTASDFGEYGEETGAWQAKEYTGTYGTNGFYLNMSTSGSTITDQSGNSNNWTANNMNLTTSTTTTYDLMSDVPHATDEDTGNYPTCNPLRGDDFNATYSNGNMTATLGGSSVTGMGTANWHIPTTGKWYWEVTIGNFTQWCALGIRKANATLSDWLGYTANDYSVSQPGITKHNDTTYDASYTATSMASGDVFGVAFDADNGTLKFYQNGTDLGTAFTGLTDEYLPAFSGSSSVTQTLNFGQQPFRYTPPTGYKKLNTYNLPDSSITDGSQYMNTVLYTGDDSADRAITGVGFSPDLVWTKTRNIARSHWLMDSVRGTSVALSSDTTSADTNLSGEFDSFDSDGFTISHVSGQGRLNYTGRTYVAWNWRGSDFTAVSNTDGTITSTVSANTTSGFSVVTYTGNGTAGATVGHGLGSAPAVMIGKNRTYGVNWRVYHQSLGATQYLNFNLTNAVSTSSLPWNNTAPTSSVFTLGTSDNVNRNGDNIVMYCFAEVEGFSKFGSYTGNGSSDGTFVYTGFRPAFVMIKNTGSTSAGAHWFMFDNKRNVYNLTNNELVANTSVAENVADPNAYLDLLSNGFKLRQNTYTNISGINHIYMAFAENPFKNSLAR